MLSAATSDRQEAGDEAIVSGHEVAKKKQKREIRSMPSSGRMGKGWVNG
jgi:hypothetical protein